LVQCQMGESGFALRELALERPVRADAVCLAAIAFEDERVFLARRAAGTTSEGKSNGRNGERPGHAHGRLQPMGSSAASWFRVLEVATAVGRRIQWPPALLSARSADNTAGHGHH